VTFTVPLILQRSNSMLSAAAESENKVESLFHSDIRRYELPKGVLPDEGINDIIRYINYYYSNYSANEFRAAIGTDWTVTGKHPYVGTMPKRIAKWFYKVRAYNLSEDMISEIGNIGSRYLDKKSEFDIDFTQTFEWKDGDFGDSGSCFWGGRSTAKDMLVKAGAYAMRFYDTDSGRGIGRSWLMPIENNSAYMLFNSYGPYQIWTLARLLSHITGMPYKKVQLSNRGDCCGVLYINSNMGMMLGSEELLDKTTSYDFNLQDIRKPYCTCSRCSVEIYSSGEAYTANDLRFCWDCFSTIPACNYCGVRINTARNQHIEMVDTVVSPDTYTFCSTRCIESAGYCSCNDCHNYVWDSELVRTIGNNRVCPTCVENYQSCEACNGRTRELEEVRLFSSYVTDRMHQVCVNCH